MKYPDALAYITDIARTGSIRKTAERLGFTPSSLTRKIKEFERELGTPLFERLRHGMRLNAAGAVFVQHARNQVAELDRMRAQIADLSGQRRGHVALVCSQAFVDHVVPDEVAAYRARFPEVSFSVEVRDHAQATAALVAYDAELALILQPPPMPALQTLFTSEHPVCAIMDARHKLAGEGPVRLRACLDYPVAMPNRTLAVRQTLDAALLRAGLAAAAVVESGSIELLRNYVRRESVVSFQVSMGLPAERNGLVVRELDRRDVPPLTVALSRLRDRPLSVLATTFVEQLSGSFRQHGNRKPGLRDRRRTR